MLKLSYERFMELLIMVSQFNKREQDVFEYLARRPDFEGGFTELTLALGRKKSDTPNIRRAVMHLEELGVVYVARDLDAPSRIRGMFIVDCWYEYCTTAYI